MPQGTIGKITFEKSFVDDRVDSEVVVFEGECSPPLAGRQKHYSPPTRIPFRLLRQFLQGPEQSAMIEGVTTPGSPAPSLDDLLSQVTQAFDIKALDIDLTAIPDAWKQVIACYQSSIAYQVKYRIWEIASISGSGMGTWSSATLRKRKTISKKAATASESSFAPLAC